VRSRRVLLWLGLALIGIDLVFLSGASNFLAAPQSRILNQVLILVVMIGWAIAAWRGVIDVRSPLVLPGLAWIAATAISATFAERPSIGLEGLALLLLSAPAYLTIRAMTATDWLRDRVDWLIVGATTVFVIAYLLQAATQWWSYWSVAGVAIPPLRPGDVGLTVGTVNAVALYLELLAPLAVWLSWTRWRRRGFSVGLAVLSAGALLVTGSRGAWLGAVAGIIVGLVVAWLAAGRPMPRDAVARGVPRVVVVGAGLGVVVLIVSSPVLIPRLLAGDAGRVELWSAAWSMFVGSPIAGVGLGGWPDARALTPISIAALAVLTTAHDSVLQILAETGLLGLLAGAWLVVAVTRTGWRAIRAASEPALRTLRTVVFASLAAVAVHSLVDTQFHIPGVVLLTFLLVARLDPRTVDQTPTTTVVGRRAAIAGLVAILVGAIVLVPIDVAMVRGQLGNLALDRGDAATATTEFDAAVALHDLPSYRLGQGIARTGLGDAAPARAALDRLNELAPFTFSSMQLALAGGADVDALLARVEADGPYDATAMVNVALARAATDPAQATEDLAQAMAVVPPLIFSDRPPSLFDDAIWSAAQTRAVTILGETDPVTASAVASVAGLPQQAAAQRAAVSDPAVLAALDHLEAVIAGRSFDLGEARALLRDNASSTGVQDVLWLLGFEATSQPLIDAVTAVAVPTRFATPFPPMELVVDGSKTASYSLRLPRWPMAETSRQAPKRPYIDGVVTIEPVFRPGR
jgi:O-antigen ligase